VGLALVSQVPGPETVDHRRMALFGGALSLAALTTVGDYAFLWSKEGAPIISATDPAGHETKPQTHSLPSRIDTVRIAVQDHLSRLTSTHERPKREQGALAEYYSDPKKSLSGLTLTALRPGTRSL
jgi:hypothetical protein